MMKKILTSLVLLSLICVVLVGAETSGLSTTSSSPAPKPVCAGLGENVYDMDSKGPTSCCSGLVLKLCTGTCTPSILGTCEKACEGVEYNGNCYRTSFVVEDQDTFYTTKEIIKVTDIEGSHCGTDENGETICTPTASSVDLTINYRCTGGTCPTYEEQIILLKDEQVQLEFSGIILKLKSTNVNLATPTATIEIISGTSSCPTDCNCDSNGNIISCDISSCPSGCICKGGTTTCPSEKEPTITTTIQTSKAETTSTKEESTSTKEETSSKSEKTTSISLSKVEDKTSIKSESGKVEAVTSEKVVVVDSKLLIETSTGTKEIKVMPEEAEESAKESLKIESVKEVELTTESEKAVYSVTGTKKAKVIAVFPVEMKVEAKVSAETGEVISMEKPWWSFLAKEE